MAMERERLRQAMPPELWDICEKVAQRGWQRVILLGDDVRCGKWSLRYSLAQAGTPVLMPNPQDRAWIQGLVAQADDGRRPDADERARLGALLADGIEHGVDALLVTDPALCALVREVVPAVPLLEIRRDDR